MFETLYLIKRKIRIAISKIIKMQLFKYKTLKKTTKRPGRQPCVENGARSREHDLIYRQMVIFTWGNAICLTT